MDEVDAQLSSLGVRRVLLVEVPERLQPGVAGEADPNIPGFGRAEVHLDGLERLWGPEPLIADRIGEALAEILPGPLLAGIGGTRFAAAVAASLCRSRNASTTAASRPATAAR